MKDDDDDDYGDAAASLPVVAGTDCDDLEPQVNPGIAEGPSDDPICTDGVDNDCDGLVDGDDPTCVAPVACPDADADGFADCTSDPSCDPTGLTCGDCDDGEPAVNPDEPEVCDNLDNDCNATVDDGFDVDDDGFTTCDLPVADCNDADPLVNPGAVEICDDAVDNDCNAATPDLFDNDGDGASCEVDCNDDDPQLNLDDADTDGFNSCAGDCNDADPDVNPDATDVCDGVDNNCDGVVDDTFDLDMDGYSPCSLPVGDCNESDPTVNPGADEICNDAEDNDCNPATPDVFDSDGDGASCVVDCDDADPASFPGATESCDGNDNDCDTSVPADELDGDGDLHVACSGWNDTQGDDPTIVGGDDCDDTDLDTFPGAAPNESVGTACMTDRDGDDFGDLLAMAPVVPGTDCDDDDASTFLGAAPLDSAANCMRDADGDDYGDATAVLPVVAGSDCDDDALNVNPGVTEGPAGDPVCEDLVDNDCDMLVDGSDPGCAPAGGSPSMTPAGSPEPSPTKRRALEGP
jgi:hypothetical protein